MFCTSCSLEVVNVNLREKPDWFLARNPLGKVPTLELDNTVVYESAVCNEWLEAMCKNAERSVIPPDATEAAKQKMIVERLSAVYNGSSKFPSQYNNVQGDNTLLPHTARLQ